MTSLTQPGVITGNAENFSSFLSNSTGWCWLCGRCWRTRKLPALTTWSFFNTEGVVPLYSRKTWACSWWPGSISSVKWIQLLLLMTLSGYYGALWLWSQRAVSPHRTPFFKCSLEMQNGVTQWNFPSKGTGAMKRAEKISEVEPGLFTRDQCTLLVLQCMYIFIMDYGNFL